MSILEFASRFAEPRPEQDHYRHPGVVVLEFGGGSCNKASEPSCKDFCAVPKGKKYNPSLDPPIEMISLLLQQATKLKPAAISIVPNGEGVDTRQKSNERWETIFKLKEQKQITSKQFLALDEYYVKQYKFPLIKRKEFMTPAEKMAFVIALGTNTGLNISLTTNGSFLNRNLLNLYHHMGLQTINLSYHPNIPYNPNKYNPDLEHLIVRAKEAIDADIIPTITHVLTRKNAETFVALADYVTEHDIFFAVGIANARGGAFSTNFNSVEPADEQVKMVLRRLLARKLFADRHVRTTIPYLLLAPYLKNSWVCSQTTDFFHISIEFVNGRLQPKLNVCSEVRPGDGRKLEDFLEGNKLDIPAYLSWRQQAKNDPSVGCKTCIHQCWFEEETRSGFDLSVNNPFHAMELWDYWDTSGKALRLRYTFHHPVRPTVSDRKDFQNPYLWKSLLQSIARTIAGLEGNNYWQKTFRRSGVDFHTILASCVDDVSDPEMLEQLIIAEGKDEIMLNWSKKIAANGRAELTSSPASNWHDALYPQSQIFHAVYLQLQRSGKEGNLAVPLKFAGLLRCEDNNRFRKEIETILFERRCNRITIIDKNDGTIFPFSLRRFFLRLLSPKILIKLYLSQNNNAKAKEKSAIIFLDSLYG